MSTQSAQSILFTHTAPQQAFRLLELPADLAELLSSDNPPTYEHPEPMSYLLSYIILINPNHSLEIKSPTPSSQESNPTDPPTDTTREYINLCTPTQTYRIRQVQSSNSLHILRPSDDGIQRGNLAVVGGPTTTEDPVLADMNLSETMTTIAKCGSTLELHTPQEGFNIIPVLEGLLGRYDSLSDGNTEQGRLSESTDRRKIIEGVFADVPVSRMQCGRAWREVCAFVLPDTGRGWVPTAKVKIGVWKRAVEGSVLQGIDLGKQFLVRDVWRSVLDENGEGEWPRELFEAVVRRVCEAGDSDGGLLMEGEMKWASIDKEGCVRWVGETYLEAVAPTANAALGRSEFLNAWKDHLPEGWREEVALSKLTEDKHRFPDPTTICFVNDDDRQKLKKNLSTDASASTTAKKTRNWHELFKNQKRQKR
ncbi:sister chromatid cohesion protein Dcc1 [Aspergillus sclerotioniger CBS 115572]|uniref:Sister chromatid cohesion protein Dcc1 n=1 Tax=Aspergillus sclerotioniger CBS 115572 TaxID=1450535 RepID=A0A317VGT3_9EURO|nr:sister chromatid cohesion protein Dcc1 [Aspergillus sclerotioniger CBS 115572]PWY72218.1 sister chromatid cohesion protein Dcc1 [Aspergillus sclerotioniger CBS 115572]